MSFEEFDDAPKSKKGFMPPPMRKNISELVPKPIPTLSERGMSSATMATKKLDEMWEDVLEWIVQGVSFVKVAEKLNIPESSFFYWRKNSKYSALITEALEFSSWKDEQRAEDILTEAIEMEEESIAQVMVRKELSQYYRWRASKKKPHYYGNNTEIKHTHTLNHNVTDDQFKQLLETAKASGNKVISEDERDGVDEGDYINFEETKDNQNDDISTSVEEFFGT